MRGARLVGRRGPLSHQRSEARNVVCAPPETPCCEVHGWQHFRFGEVMREGLRIMQANLRRQRSGMDGVADLTWEPFLGAGYTDCRNAKRFYRIPARLALFPSRQGPKRCARDACTLHAFRHQCAKVRMDLGGWVRMARARMGWSLRQTADAMQCTPSTVSHWEHGRHEPSYRQVVRLAHLTGQPLPGISVPAASHGPAPTAVGLAPEEVRRMLLADWDELPLDDQIKLVGVVHSLAEYMRLNRRLLMEKITPRKTRPRKPGPDDSG